MGSGWHEWPLMIFTVFGQCGRWFYCSGSGADEGRPARGNAAAGDRLYVWSVGADGDWLYRLDAASGLADARLTRLTAWVLPH